MLPLLAKEMIARAGDRRHYAGRVALAVIAALVVGVSVGRFAGASVTDMLGHGHAIFHAMVALCWVAVMSVVPATCGAAVPTERDRGTIELLRLTRLGPWRLVFELWLARLVPLGIALLVVAPIGSMAYAFGGVTVEMLARAASAVAVLAMMIGAMALWFGAISISPVSGAMRGYASTLIVVLLLPTVLAGMQAPPSIVVVLSPLAAYYEWSAPAAVSAWAVWGGPVAWTVVCLLGARSAIGSERFGRRRPRRRRRRARDVPVRSPLLWRERRRSRWTSIRGLAATVVVAAVLAMGVSALGDESRTGPVIGAILSMIYIFSIVGSTVSATNVFVRERSRQTLDVLLTTPTPTAEFVSSRVWVIVSHAIAGAVAFAIVVHLHPLFHFSTGLKLGYSLGSFAATIAAGGAIGLWIGLGQRRAMRATLLSIALIIALHMGGIGALTLGLGSAVTWGVMLVVLAVWVAVGFWRASASEAVVAAWGVVWVAVAAVGFVLIENGSDDYPFDEFAVLMLFPTGAFGSEPSLGEPWCCVLYLLLIVVSAVVLCRVDGDRRLGRVPARVARR